MNNKTIIHVGYPKTGSTWFQNELFNKVKNYNVIDRRKVKQEFILENGLDFNANKIKNKYKNLDSIILSQELLAGGMMHTGGINGILTKEFANRLRSVFSDVEIIIFIRNQPDIIASAYNQYIRGGGNFGINKYLYQKSFRAFNRYFFFSFDFLKYDKIISYYKKLFGEDSVNVFLFEDFTNNHSKFVKDFCNKFNFDVDIDSLDFSPVNTKFRKFIKPVYRFSNLFYRRSVLNKYNIFNFDSWFEPMKYRFGNWNKYKIFGPFETTEQILGKKNINYIKNYYKESNKKLIEQHGITGIKNYNYPL